MRLTNMASRGIIFRVVVVAALAALFRPGAARAELIRDLVSPVGVYPLAVEGTGVVTGLAGRGDKSRAALKFLRNYIENQGLPLDEGDLATGNLALVRVEAIIPPNVAVGKYVSARVSAIGGATDLSNGNLLTTELGVGHGRDIKCYARASGKIMANRGDLVNALLPANEYGGAMVIMPNPMRAVDIVDGSILLALNRPSYSDAAAIARAINQSALNPFRQDSRGFGEVRQSPEIAIPVDGGRVQVTIPRARRRQEVQFIEEMYRLEVYLERPPRIVVNHAAGTVLAVGDFKIENRGVVSVQGKTVTIGPPPPPGDPNDRVYTLDDGTPRAVVELGGHNTETELNQLITTLNAMGLDSREVAGIFQQLRDKGVLRAELYVE